MLALKRVVNSPNRFQVLDYFGSDLMKHNLDKNLNDLSEHIIAGNYKPKRPIKFFQPKKSKTQRTQSILFIEDAIVYQAIVNRIAYLNYDKIIEFNHISFSSILNENVKLGLDLLDSENKIDFTFFKDYLPNWNKFKTSIDKEVEEGYTYCLETDITGFFDSIPHSKLLYLLSTEFSLEKPIIDLLAHCLNIFSGTKYSITPGVGIPQGQEQSYFLANLLLLRLDEEINQKGVTYFRYMDDIRLFDKDEKNILDSLVSIDNYLKNNALSVNGSKTKISKINKKNRIISLNPLNAYSLSKNRKVSDQVNLEEVNVISNFFSNEIQINDEDENYKLKDCYKELKEIENKIFKLYQKLQSKNILDEEKDGCFIQIFQLTQSWRTSNVILSNYTGYFPSKKLIDIWFYLLENFFWKANAFLACLIFYKSEKEVENRIINLINDFGLYEWVRYQLIYSLKDFQLNTSQLKNIFRILKNDNSDYVRLSCYMLLLDKVKQDSQLFLSVLKSLKNERHKYIRDRVKNWVEWRENDFEKIIFIYKDIEGDE